MERSYPALAQLSRAMVESPSLVGFNSSGDVALGDTDSILKVFSHLKNSHFSGTTDVLWNSDLSQTLGSSESVCPAGTDKLQSKQPLFAEKYLLFSLDNPSRN